MLAWYKTAWRPYTTLLGTALVVAILARIGLAIMDVNGYLAYDYISSSGVPILDVICSILTGSAFAAFILAFGLSLTVCAAGVALYGFIYAQLSSTKARLRSAFVGGWLTALVALICLLVVASGILSAVQLHSLSSKLPGLPILLVALVVFAAFIGTLLAAASLVLSFCLERIKAGANPVWLVPLCAAVCGLPVLLLAVGTFAAINTAAVSLPTVGSWLVGDLALNLIIMIAAALLLRRAQTRTV
ncbi:MAG: hypothetical protein LBR39_00855 [Coriobacteriales bacterium]|jgi:hypothetical protein|nr:hypothetical protein [Coriobacteriales bacterium]